MKPRAPNPAGEQVARLLQEIAAAPTRRAAEDIFANHDWLFVDMKPREREIAYQRVDDIINEKPQ